MKRFLLPLICIAILASCGNKTNSSTGTERSGSIETHDTLQTGDLLFVGLPMSYSLAPDAVNEPANAQTCAGDSLNLIHVAIIEIEHDTTWIIDATIKHNVARYPLDTFLRDFTLADGSHPYFIIKRLNDSKLISSGIARAKTFIGRTYDTEFLPDNDALFCSELIRNSFLTDDGQYIFSNYPMDFTKKNGTFPLYWTQIFQLIHSEIPQGEIGTTPAQMMREPCLRNVNFTIE